MAAGVYHHKGKDDREDLPSKNKSVHQDEQGDRLDVGQTAHGLLADDEQRTHQPGKHQTDNAVVVTSCR